MEVVVVGLGVVGSRIAVEVAGAGHQVGLVDADPHRVSTVARALRPGAHRSGDTVELVAGAEAAIVAVPGPDESCDVAFGGAADLVRGLPAGSLYIDCTTSSPQAVERVARASLEAGLHFVDAPLSGLPPGSTCFLGGSEAAVAAASPLLDSFVARTFHLGPVGHGTVVKLMNQRMAFANFVTCCEAFALCEAHGIDRRTAYETIRHSFGTSAALGAFASHVLGGELDETPGRLGIVLKDLHLASEAHRDAGLTASPSFEHAVALFEQAAATYGSDVGYARVWETVLDRSGIAARSATSGDPGGAS